MARHYSLVTGWGPSYPETTGYIAPTMLAAADRYGATELEARGRRMLDWLVGIQLAGGGYQGGTVDQTPVVPVTFNTGQILIGLADGARRYGDPYLTAMRRAADWLVETQDRDGAWRAHPTPFAESGDKAYETHVSWGLVEASRVISGRGYLEAAHRNALWALGRQRANGWVADCCLADPARPLTHTLGYFLRGLIEIGIAAEDNDLMAGAQLTASALLPTISDDGAIPGRLADNWQPAANWCCLTGNVQIATCWLLLGKRNGSAAMIAAGRQANRFVRRTVAVTGPDGVRGGVKGSFPVDGDYGQFQFLNWAAKFLIDSCMIEDDVDRPPTG